MPRTKIKTKQQNYTPAERQTMLAAALLANPNRLWGILEAADLLGCASNSLRVMAREGAIPSWTDEIDAAPGFRYLLEASTLVELLLDPNERPQRTPIPTLGEMRARHTLRISAREEARA
jgi:hypothetical protein